MSRWSKEQRGNSPALPTVPSTIQEEKNINPFMRVTTAGLLIILKDPVLSQSIYVSSGQNKATAYISRPSSELETSYYQVSSASVQAHTGTSDPVETMAALRGEKDSFKAPAQ